MNVPKGWQRGSGGSMTSRVKLVQKASKRKIRWEAHRRSRPEATRRTAPPLLFCFPFESGACIWPAARGESLSWEASVSPTRSSAAAPPAPRWSGTPPPSVQSGVPRQSSSCWELCEGREAELFMHLLFPGLKMCRSKSKAEKLNLRLSTLDSKWHTFIYYDIGGKQLAKDLPVYNRTDESSSIKLRR